MTSPTNDPVRLIQSTASPAKGPWFRFSREIKLSDMISAGSLAIAAFTFVVAQCRNTKAEDQVYGESIRSSAIGEIQTARRVKHRTDHVFESAQVWASRAAQFPQDSVDAAVEFLYQSISKDRFEATAAIREERRSVTFAALYGHSPCASAAFDTTLTQLQVAADMALHDLVDTATSLARRRGKGASAQDVREQMRASIRNQKATFDRLADSIGRPLDSTLISLIRSDDSAIIQGRGKQPEVACGTPAPRSE